MEFKRFLLQHFHKEIFLLIIVNSILLSCSSSGEKYLVFIGTYSGNGSDGLYSLKFDPSEGKTSPPVLAAKTDNPSFIAVSKDGKILYAVNETNNFKMDSTGAISVFEIKKVSGNLKLLQQVSSLGADPAHLSIDKTGKYLLVANYSGGNYAIFPIRMDGKLGEKTVVISDTGSSINKDRQKSPHPHFIQSTTDNKYILVADLGLDKIMIYKFDDKSGSLIPNEPSFIKIDSGSGPRHFESHPSGKYFFVLNELSSTITVFSFDLTNGSILKKQTISTLPGDFTGLNTSAEILIDSKGKFLYASNRGDDSIVQFSINSEDGTLTTVELVPSGGKTPRNFAIDPTGEWLFSANQNSNNILLFRIDKKSGRLIKTDQIINVKSPVCICFLLIN